MPPQIGLILAPRADVHAHAVAYAAERMGGCVQILDAQEFTRCFDLQTRIGVSDTSFQLTGMHLPGSLDASSVSGIWYRRPLGYPHAASQVDNGGVDALAELERRAAIFGSLDGFVGKAFNDIGATRKANHKPTQLMRARAIGLTIPETLITNDAVAVREFVALIDGPVVYKMFGSPPNGLYGTRLLESEDVARLDRLKSCPAIFQEFIDGDFDIRATVVGKKVFSAQLVFERKGNYFDTRFVKTEVKPHVLPAEIEIKLVEFVQSFGLIYSAIDLRYSKKRGYVFFESNPGGQYLWIEIETGLPISHEIAMQLLN